MKKLSILLIGLLLVAGLAVAQEFDGSVSVSGSASVTFGVDLNTNATGFQNTGSSSISITLVGDTDLTKGGDDGLYGEITIDSATITAAPGGSVGGSVGSVSAKIVIDPASITIYTAPGFNIDKAVTLEAANEASVSTTLTADNVGGTFTVAAIQGITISVPAGPATIDLKVASDGNWEANVDNQYAAGVGVALDIDPVDVGLALTYGWFDAAQIGIGVNAGLSLADVVNGLDITVGADMNIPDGGDLAWDLAAGVTLNISEANADDAMANVALKAYVAPYGVDDMDLDLTLGVTEPEAGGLVDMLSASLAVQLFDLLAPAPAEMIWNVDVTGAYNTGDVKPYFGFGYGSDEVFNLNAGVELYAGLTGIDNTTITLDYVSTDLQVDNGIITVKVAIAY